MVGVVLLEGRAHHGEILLEGRDDELAAAFGGISLGEEAFYFALHGGGRTGQIHVDDFGFAARPGRLIADEIADQPGVVLARRKLSFGALFEELGELTGIDVGHSQIHRDLGGVASGEGVEVGEVGLAVLGVSAARYDAG